MAITTLEGLLTGVRQDIPYFKSSITNPGASNWLSFWRAGGNPGAGTDPSAGVAGVVLTSADAGAIPFVDPGSGLSYLTRMVGSADARGKMILFDRLWHNSGLSPTATTAQTVNSVTLPARCPVKSDPTGETFDTLGYGVEAWFQVMGTVMGAGTVAPTITYTDEDGNTGNVGTQQNWVSAMATNRTSPFSRVAGDGGVRSIQSYQQTATQTSGVFSLVLRRRIATLFLPDIGIPAVADWNELGMPVIPNGAHLELVWIPVTSTTTSFQGEISLVQG